MNKSRYQSITYVPYKQKLDGEIRGDHIEIVHEGQKITGVIMEREFRSIIVDITSPYWNASKGIALRDYHSSSLVFYDSHHKWAAKDLLLNLYLDCKHAYENADPAFWENELYSKFYLREYVPYDELSDDERFYGPQIAKEDMDLYYESREHINWPDLCNSYKRKRLHFIGKLNEEDERNFPDSSVRGNMVEIMHEGQKVRGEIVKRDSFELQVRIRYPYDGIVESASVNNEPYPPYHIRYKGFDYEAGDLAAKRVLRQIYRRCRTMQKHLDDLLAGYEEYKKLMALEEEKEDRKKANLELQEANKKLSEIRDDLREGKIRPEDYRELRRPFAVKKTQMQRIVKIDRRAIYNEAFKKVINIPVFKVPHKYIFDVVENPEIIRGKYSLESVPPWFSMKLKSHEYTY